MFVVTNKGPRPRLVRVLHSQKLVRIPPGGTSRPLEMAANDAIFHRKLQMRGDKLHITADNDEETALLDGSQSVKPEGDRAALSRLPIQRRVRVQEPVNPEAVEPPTPTEQPNQQPARRLFSGEDPGTSVRRVASPGKRTASLLARADEMSYPAFRSEAKEILGDRYPGGRVKKDELIALLNGEQ